MTTTTTARYYSPEPPTPLTYDHLRRHLWKGSVIYAIRRYDGASGTIHHLSVVTILEGRIVDITVSVARVTGRRLTRENHILVKGGGLDPVNAIGCDLSAALWGDAYALTARTL